MEQPKKPFVFALRPEYVERILDGSKLWEFRKRMPRHTMGDIAMIYESRGRGKIVGCFTVGSMLHTMTPGDLWRTVETMTPGGHGIEREAYNDYYRGRSGAVAFGVESPVVLDLALPWNMSPPQSWSRWLGAWPL